MPPFSKLLISSSAIPYNRNGAKLTNGLAELFGLNPVTFSTQAVAKPHTYLLIRNQNFNTTASQLSFRWDFPTTNKLEVLKKNQVLSSRNIETAQKEVDAEPRPKHLSSENPVPRNETKLRKRFTPEEDQLILHSVEIHGASNDTFVVLNEELMRVDWQSVKRRYDVLISKGGADGRKAWSLSDDTALMTEVVKVSQMRAEIFRLR